MALMKWISDYSVEVDSIDREHQILFDMINNLHDAMMQGKGARLAPTILKNLVQYTREHFSREEGLMIQAHYPDLIHHQAEHDKLTAEVVKLVQDMEVSKAPVSMKLLDFLRDWLQTHILGMDKKYTVYLQAAGIH
jgi:hemerythrin-like metal-binding protein